MAIIYVFTRLLVLGGKVRVPGHEPLSEQTTHTLSVAMQNKDPYIDLNRALNLIPGSKVVTLSLNDGSNGSEKYFELPTGPIDGNSCACPPDWYKILRDAATFRNFDEEAVTGCDAFPDQSCDFTDFTNDLNPANRT